MCAKKGKWAKMGTAVTFREKSSDILQLFLEQVKYELLSLLSNTRNITTLCLSVVKYKQKI
jgi:hypothetical protein